MNWIENLMIIGGVSLDVFATMECQGSLVAKIEKKGLAAICGMVCIWQLAAYSAGSWLASFLIQRGGIAEKERFIGNKIAVAIFIGLGIHLLAKAVRNEKLIERREKKLNKASIFHGMSQTGCYTFLAGIAFGFLGSDLLFSLVSVALFSILAVVGGTYTGYHFGFKQRQKAYGAGAILLWIAGADVWFRFFLK